MFKLSWLLLLAGCCATGCATYRGVEESNGNGQQFELSPQEQTFAKALAHYSQSLLYEGEEGKLSDRAVDALRQAIEQDPSRYELYVRAAALYLQQRKPQEAIAIIQKAAATLPHHPQVKLDLGVLFEATEQFEQAAQLYRSALRTHSDQADVYAKLARVLFRLDQDDAALDVLQNGLRRSVDPAPILLFAYACGIDFVAARQPERAVGCFDLLSRHDPERQDEFNLLLGELYEALQQPDQAIRYFEKATLDTSPPREAFLRLSAMYLEHAPELSLKTLQRAQTLFPDDVHILSSLGFVYTFKQELDMAIDAFALAEQLAGTSDGSHEAFVLNPAFYLHYGAAHEQAGQHQEAAEVFLRALEHYPEYHPILNYLAYMWAVQNVNLRQAETYVMQALAEEPDNGAYVDTLGWVYYRQERFEEALEQIERANRLLPDDPTILEHLGDVHFALGNLEAATAAWTRSMKLDPEDPEAIMQKLELHRSIGE